MSSIDSHPSSESPRLHSSRVKTHIVFAFIFHANMSMTGSVGSTPRSLHSRSRPSIWISSTFASLYWSNTAFTFSLSTDGAPPPATCMKKKSAAASSRQSVAERHWTACESVAPVHETNARTLSFCARLSACISVGPAALFSAPAAPARRKRGR